MSDYDYDYDYNNEDDNNEDDNNEDDYEVEADYEEDEGSDEELGQELDLRADSLRGLTGAARQQNCGIHTIELYYPQFYFDHVELEEFDARPDRYGPTVIGKYVKGIGMLEGRLPTDDEDPVSFAMTSVHRLLERMEREGFNETGRFTKDGKALDVYQAVGRLDVGTESLIDRSKSMKTYIMDIFERYGDGQANIEGVDMYNACYGGQAAGLVNLSWVESDRWDGRYGIAVATDIQDVPNIAVFAGGSSSSATVFFPDAPMSHHSLRASCILHRFDFFKPVGWHNMGPVLDGKYSVNAYMDCVETCYTTLKSKLNGQSIVKSCDYNIFHTGGGFHIVKKAYDRIIRADDNTMPQADRAAMTVKKLMPGVRILKIIGPTHTVSSFCNMCSVIMSEWENIIGRILVVFTYGSGSAASMYQTRFDDLPWMQPFEQWRVRFYADAMKQHPRDMGLLQDIYCEVWMKFDYIPYGRRKFQIDPWAAQPDAYYLMEIDPWGRRFYHRGGIAAGPRDPKWTLQADIDESRKERKHWGPIPEKKAAEEGTKQLEDEWLKLEVEMLQQLDPPKQQTLQVGRDRVNPKKEIVCTQVVQSDAVRFVKKDESDHTYQIVGTWSDWKEPLSMTETGPSSYSCEITLGENGWEEFYILQDNDNDKKICPVLPRSWKSLPCIGPHPSCAGHWLIEGRDSANAPLEDAGEPGDIYLVSFSWKGAAKLLEWNKVNGKTGSFPMGKYYLNFAAQSGSTEMTSEGDGKFSLEVTLSKSKMAFYIVRNQDVSQLIYPEVEQDAEYGESGCSVVGVGPWHDEKTIPMWSIQGDSGDTYKVLFTRTAGFPDDMSLVWTKRTKLQIETASSVEKHQHSLIEGADAELQAARDALSKQAATAVPVVSASADAELQAARDALSKQAAEIERLKTLLAQRS